MLPSLYISHGSPMLALEPGESGPALKRLAAQLAKPKAIVLLSAHWESADLRVASHPAPETWHDFGGFPRELYAVQYPAPGDPALAARIVQLLATHGLPAQLDAKRPFDHGAWVPLSLMYPAADIPVVQVSLPSQLGPAGLNEVGQALASLRSEGILIKLAHKQGSVVMIGHPYPQTMAVLERELPKLKAQGIDQQIRRRLPGQALLRWLRIRRRG